MKNKSLAQEQGVITLVPIGLDEEGVLEVLGEDLERVFACQVRIATRLELPGFFAVISFARLHQSFYDLPGTLCLNLLCLFFVVNIETNPYS